MDVNQNLMKSRMRSASASSGEVFQLLTGSLQALFAGQSPAQTVFPLQAKRVVIHFRFDDINFAGYFILKPVPYLHHHRVLSPFLTSSEFVRF
jgi:hypothetical protein